MYYTAIFHGCKNNNFQMKNGDSFLIFVQNIDCVYTLEPPLKSTHNLCFRAKICKPCKPQFYYIKVGCKGVYMYITVIRTCYPDDLNKYSSQQLETLLACCIMIITI